MTDSFLAGIEMSPSPNHGPRPDGAVVDMLVLHYTGMPDAASALARMCDPAAQVSAHYMVDEDGLIRQLVPEARRAWHAGVAQWRGRGDVNSHSIGIEIVNPGHEFGYRPFPDRQMQAVIALCLDILDRWPTVSPAGIVGHSDIAPTRKEDPGELFDWPLLARHGIGRFPVPGAGTPPQGGEVARLLSMIGYGLEGDDASRKALIAFQRRYCPQELFASPGEPGGATMAMLRAVAAEGAEP